MVPIPVWKQIGMGFRAFVGWRFFPCWKEIPKEISFSLAIISVIFDNMMVMNRLFSQFFRLTLKFNGSRLSVLVLIFPISSALGNDSDSDGLDDTDEEFIYYTDPYEFDTDGDTFGDGEEVLTYYTDPFDPYDYPMGDGGTVKWPRKTEPKAR